MPKIKVEDSNDPTIKAKEIANDEHQAKRQEAQRKAKERELRIKWSAFRLRLLHTFFGLPAVHLNLLLNSSQLPIDEIAAIRTIISSAGMKMTQAEAERAVGMAMGMKTNVPTTEALVESWVDEIASGKMELPEEDFINRLTAST